MNAHNNDAVAKNMHARCFARKQIVEMLRNLFRWPYRIDRPPPITLLSELVWEHVMNVSNIASLATSLSSEKTGQAVGIAVLKKALDIQSATAAVLLDAIPKVSSANLPANLGRNVNTVA